MGPMEGKSCVRACSLTCSCGYAYVVIHFSREIGS